MTLPCVHTHIWSCSTKSFPLLLNPKVCRQSSNVCQNTETRRLNAGCRPQRTIYTRLVAVANANRSDVEQRLDSDQVENAALKQQDESIEGDGGEDQKAALGQKKIAQWMATSSVKPATAMSIEELKNARISWQDTYKSKKQAKSSQSAARSTNKAQELPKKPKAESPAKSRGFGVIGDSKTIKLFRYSLEKAALQQVLIEAGLNKRVVQVERIEDADAIIAIKLTKKGQHINLAQAERTAENAGIPLIIAGRRLSKDSIVKAIKPLLDKKSASSSSDSPSADSEDDDWAELQPADEFEQWDPNDLDSDVFDDDIKGFKTARSGNIPGHKPKAGAWIVKPQTTPGGSIQAGSISLNGRSRPRPV